MTVRPLRQTLLAVTLTGALVLTLWPTTTRAEEELSELPQSVAEDVLQAATITGDVAPQQVLSVDIVLRVRNQSQLTTFIRETTTPSSPNYRRFLSVPQFKELYGPPDGHVHVVTKYLASFGIQSHVYANNLIITATGTAEQFEKALTTELELATFNGKNFRAATSKPKLPKPIAESILCVMGLTTYSELNSLSMKRPAALEPHLADGPLSLTPNDLIQRYNVQPLYQQGATGAGQTIGIVTLADFNAEDAYAYWNMLGLSTKPNRIEKVLVDGGSGFNGYGETTLDVQQSGALAPQADIDVYIGPNTDQGFLNTFATAINRNEAQQISTSWGSAEQVLQLLGELKILTPEFAAAMDQVFMQAAAQGISMFAASGDSGAYDAVRQLSGTGLPGVFSLGVSHPGASPYILSSGGTTLPAQMINPALGLNIRVPEERSWGWDYLHPFLDALGIEGTPYWESLYLLGSGGGFSKLFPTPWYQVGVPGVNTYTAIKQWTTNADQTQITRDATPTLLTGGTGTGRNVPDFSMNADPFTGYLVYRTEPGVPGANPVFETLGGTSFVAPQLGGISALINSRDGQKRGLWTPQVYRFAQAADSPFRPLNTTGA